MNRLAIVLHAHLPYIRHEEPDRLEERWLFEAMTETYLPLIWQLEQLPKEKALTLSLSPPLLEMLADPMLQKRYMNYLQAAQALIRKEKRYGFIETDLLTFYEERYKRLEETFLSCNQNVVSLFAQYQDTVSLITTSATHAILPYMRTIEGIKAQIEAGLDCFTKHIGFRPKGFWTPECDTGIKCWRVTGKNEEKQPYHRVEAVNQVKNDASDFLKKVEQTAANAPFETVPFDAELFGHWWFEGQSGSDDCRRRDA
ncbi:hypothetical protein [Bacillus sp. JCM 19041]|uniref:hypothetical protein n=1 Tax=Bacillus sp. JCM 19041 TaxID=1460637 RepID=UPI0006D12ABF